MNHRQHLKRQKADFAKNGIPPEFDQHEWKKHIDMIVCKNCGLIKGSGFAKCEKPDSDMKSGE